MKRSETPSRRPPFYRRKYIVLPRFQLEVIFYFTGVCSIPLFILLWAVHRLTDQVLVEPAAALGAISSEAIARYQNTLNHLFIADSAVLLFFSLLGSFFLTHRIAGPIFRMQRHMKLLNSGKAPGQLRFRKGDYFQELAITLNEFEDPKQK